MQTVPRRACRPNSKRAANGIRRCGRWAEGLQSRTHEPVARPRRCIRRGYLDNTIAHWPCPVPVPLREIDPRAQEHQSCNSLLLLQVRGHAGRAWSVPGWGQGITASRGSPAALWSRAVRASRPKRSQLAAAGCPEERPNPGRQGHPRANPLQEKRACHRPYNDV